MMKTRRPLSYGSALAGILLLGTLATQPVYAQYPTLIGAQNPLDYWRLNETTPSPPPDLISNLGSAGPAGNGFAAGGALTGQPNGIVGNCARLINEGDTVGACNTRIDIPNLAALNPEPPFTIEFWANPASLSADSTGMCVLSSLSPFPGDTSRSGYLFYVNTVGWTFRLGGLDSYAATATSSSEATSNEWSYVVGEFDGTNVTLWINGVLSGSSIISSSPFNPNNWVATRLGGTSLDGSEWADANGNFDYYDGNRGYDGYVDEFAVYNTVLSSNTIMSHYTAGTTATNTYDALILSSQPVGYWNMDEPPYSTNSLVSSPVAFDLGSLMNNGTNTLGTQTDQPGVPTLGNDARSVYYNGALGSLVLDTNVTEFAFGGQPITLAAWVKPNSFGYMEDIISQGFDTTTYAQNFLCVGDVYDWEALSPDDSGGDANTNVVPNVAFYSVGTYDGVSSAYNTAVFPAPAGDIGHWVLLVGTYDGANWNLYRNGVLVNSFADDGAGPTTLTDPWSVGSRSNPNPYFGFYFDGSIEEAAILTNAVDAATVSNLYNSVPLPPVITQAPFAVEPAYLGSSQLFSVWADGTLPLGYQWEKDGAPLGGQTATNLSLTGLTATSSGTYSVVVTNAYGSVTSSLVLVVVGTLPPVTLVPAQESRWLTFPLSFAPASLPNQQLDFQWYFDDAAISGATNSYYTNMTTSGTAGTYTLVYSNSFATATSSPAVLTPLTWPAGYVSNVLANQPVALFRLDETNGSVAYDYAGGNNGTYFGSDLLFGQPGSAYVDPDFSVTFPGVADNYVGNIGATTIDFSGTSTEFSVEAWANGPAVQTSGAAIIAKGEGNNGGVANEQFALSVVGGDYTFFVRDGTVDHTLAGATATTGPDGNWHYLVGVCDSASSSLTLYIDGAVAATGSTPAAGVGELTFPVGIGAERSGVQPPYDWPYNGSIDDVAIYASALTLNDVSNHYSAAFGPDSPAVIGVQPISFTNYVNLPASFYTDAHGSVPITYQWNKNGVPINGQTANTFSIPNLALTDAGTYNCGVTNPVNGILSSNFIITVLPLPTNPVTIPGLVMHLTFDGNLLDATGRGNNATNEASGGATLATDDYAPGQIGQAFFYQTTVSGTNTSANYASVGVRPDLQLGTSNFTVSMWVQLPNNYDGGDLPFFCDVVGSTFGSPGFCFEPSYELGGWGFSVLGSTGTGIGSYSAQNNSINDALWHNLIYIIDRVNGPTVYLDGLVAAQAVQANTGAIGDIDTTVPASIGQDPTGLYGVDSGGDMFIDDLGVWNRALTPLEAEGVYSAGYNNVSFTGGAAPITLSVATVSAGTLQLSWSAGTLQGATNLLGPWTNVPGATPPFSTNTTGPAMFFRVEQ
jgi:hypothetical protein